MHCNNVSTMTLTCEIAGEELELKVGYTAYKERKETREGPGEDAHAELDFVLLGKINILAELDDSIIEVIESECLQNAEKLLQQ